MLPHQTFHVLTKTFHEHEVFRTTSRVVVPLTDIVGFAIVLSYKDYGRGRPKGVAPEDVWVCESRYNDQAKSFDRVRNFAKAFPEPKLRPNPELELFSDGPRKIPTLKSPHLTEALAKAPPAPPASASAAHPSGKAGHHHPMSPATSDAAVALVGLAGGPPSGSGARRDDGSGSVTVRLPMPGSMASLSAANMSAQRRIAAAASAAAQKDTLATSFGQLTVQTISEPGLPAIRSLLLNQTGVLQRVADGLLHVAQLLRALGVSPDRVRALQDLLTPDSAAAPPDPQQHPITAGPWYGGWLDRVRAPPDGGSSGGGGERRKADPPPSPCVLRARWPSGPTRRPSGGR